jgi:molybdate transport system substrate-binding protein
VSTGDLLDVMLREDVTLGTSTPKADPSGDYAWELFRKADGLRPGSYARLDAKAQKLTGGPDSPKAPEGRNTYGWVMDEGRADLFLTYCTNARLARKEVQGLQIVQLPDALAVGADYGLIVLAGDRPDAWRLAGFILSPDGQRILAEHGFAVAGVPAEG